MILKNLLSQYSCFGFSGSRSGVPISVMKSIAVIVPTESRIIVGCARGVDEFFRKEFKNSEVFEVASGKWGSGRGAFALRSISCVKEVKKAGGIWISFPANPCPTGLMPSVSSTKCFSGFGSGSWASLAFNIGLGTKSLVYSPSGVPTGWGLHQVPGEVGWFESRNSTGPVQLSLF